MNKNLFLQRKSILLYFFIFLVSRLLFLESDLPVWNISYYQPLDELFYVVVPFNLYEYGTVYHDVFANVKPTLQGSAGSMIETILTYISLKLFGNNFYGLRISSVFAGFMSVILLYLISMKIMLDSALNQIKKLDYIVIYTFLFYILIDFSFLMATRVAEPTIFRIFAMLLTVYIFLLFSNKTLFNTSNIFIFGLISILLFLAAYITNIFVLAAVMSSIIIIGIKQNKELVKPLIIFLIGMSTGLIIYAFIFYSIYDESLFDAILKLFQKHGNRVVSDRDMISMIKKIFVNIYYFFSTNIFKFNSSLLFLTLLSFPSMIYIMIKKNNFIYILIGNLLIFLFLQSCFINDYYHRKLIILLPIVLLVFLIVYKEKDIFKTVLHKYKKTIKIIYFLSFLFTLIIIKKNLYDEKEFVLLTINLFALLITSLFSWKWINNKLISTKQVTAFLIAFFLSNIYLDLIYGYINPEFKLKRMMQDLNVQVKDNKYTTGSLAVAVRLYNSSIPVTNKYSYDFNFEDIKQNKELFNDIKILNQVYHVKYAIDYIDKVTIDSMNNCGYDLVKIYDINEVHGKKIGLFISRNNVK